MHQDRIEMNQRERDVLKVMSVVLQKERTQAEAARLLGARTMEQANQVLDTIFLPWFSPRPNETKPERTHWPPA